MSDEPKERKSFAWTLAVSMVLLLSMYVGGYFVLSKVDDVNDPSTVNRHFGSRGVAQFFTPLGWIECKVRDKYVYLCRIRPNLPAGVPDNDAVVVEFAPEKVSR